MHDQTLTIPQHADPIARGLLFGLLAAVLGLAVGLPAPPSEASTPILVIATPALAPLSARLDSTPSLPTIPPTNEPTDPPPESPAAQVDAPATAPTLQPPAPPAPEPPAPAQAYGTAGGTAPEAAPAEASNNEPLIASGPQVPQGPQQIHQQPDSTYITVGASPVRYYVDADGQVTEVRLPGADTAPNGADIAALARATAAPSAVPVPLPPSPQGYRPRAGYRAKKP